MECIPVRRGRQAGRGGRIEVSAVIAAYNEEDRLGDCIKSLRSQTLPLKEIVVIDDGSTDGTAGVAVAAADKVRVVPHGGPARARNVGAKLARADVLVFFDADMTASPTFVERLVSPIRAGQASGTFTKEIYVGDFDCRWSRAYCAIRRLGFPRLLPESFPSRWANFRAIRRDAFLEVGGYDDVGYGEDMTVAAKLGELAIEAPGAACWHFNPSSPREIFDNGRWIGRGQDIEQVTHPWRDNSLGRAFCAGIRESCGAADWVPLAARLAYHTGLLIGLGQKKLGRRSHAK